ncbi:methionine--tRNA ligase [Candidatus Pacearchaeota archaeon]|nr:methionine--tRNA ligase [Candidatus Pacearchaeota archaeon]
MAKQQTFYITTAIDYVNAKPHVGHAFEKTITDTIARWQRLQEKDTYFTTGVDENAQKNVQAAEKKGVSVKKFIDTNTAAFQELCAKLNVSEDKFIRTTAKEHAIVVKEILEKIRKKKDIYKGTYEGLYCVGCETYYTEKELIDGKCPEHKKEPEKRTEEAYFFKLSKYEKQLLKIIPTYVTPPTRANEVMERIKKDGLTDICISRKGAQWGIDFPNDPEYKVWVWIDALINYISGLEEKEKKYWPAQVHVIGKGINWFHSVIWPALLLSAGYKLPEKLVVHGYLNTDGEKISKSLGNVIDPLTLLEKYPADVVRYSFLRCSVFEDTDYSEELLITRNNSELANKLGNLVSRVSTLAETHGLTKVKPLETKKVIAQVTRAFESYQTDKALATIFAFIDSLNELIQKAKPWETKDTKVLYQLADGIKTAAILLSPFMPATSEKIATTFHFELTKKQLESPLAVHKIKKASILFQKIDMVNKTTISPSTYKKEEVKTMKNPPISSISDTRKGDVISNTSDTKAHKQTAHEIKREEKQAGKISYDDFSKVELKVGLIKDVKPHPNADKLYVLTVDLGEDTPRTIVAGLRNHYQPEHLKGKKALFVANLAPVTLRGIESNGMILAAVNDDDSHVVILQPEQDIPPGSKIR